MVLKNAIIVPLYIWKDNKSVCKNYRQISFYDGCRGVWQNSDWKDVRDDNKQYLENVVWHSGSLRNAWMWNVMYDWFIEII